MGRRIAARLGQAVIVLWIVATVTFVLIHTAPGDPFGFESPRMTEEVRSQLRAQFGYDKPLPEQYVRYLTSTLRGEFGYSISMHAPVSEALAEALPNTLLLMGVAIVASFALGIWLAVFQVRNRGAWRSRLAGDIALVFYSVPDFWLALLLLVAFTYWIPVLPAGGAVDQARHEFMTSWPALADRLQHLVLPALSLTLLTTAGVARYQRAELLEVLPLDFVRTARAKGLSDRQVLRRHVLRNALIPTITLAGLAFPALLGGAVLVEKVFSWPGMGQLAVRAIMSRDYPLVQASAIVAAVMVIAGNLLADLAYMRADPRLRGR